MKVIDYNNKENNYASIYLIEDEKTILLMKVIVMIINYCFIYFIN